MRTVGSACFGSMCGPPFETCSSTMGARSCASATTTQPALAWPRRRSDTSASWRQKGEEEVGGGSRYPHKHFREAKKLREQVGIERGKVGKNVGNYLPGQHSRLWPPSRRHLWNRRRSPESKYLFELVRWKDSYTQCIENAQLTSGLSVMPAMPRPDAASRSDAGAGVATNEELGLGRLSLCCA